MLVNSCRRLEVFIKDLVTYNKQKFFSKLKRLKRLVAKILFK